MAASDQLSDMSSIRLNEDWWSTVISSFPSHSEARLGVIEYLNTLYGNRMTSHNITSVWFMIFHKVQCAQSALGLDHENYIYLQDFYYIKIKYYFRIMSRKSKHLIPTLWGMIKLKIYLMHNGNIYCLKNLWAGCIKTIFHLVSTKTYQPVSPLAGLRRHIAMKPYFVNWKVTIIKLVFLDKSCRPLWLRG